MAEFIKVDALGDACPLPVVKTLKALKQLDGEGTVVTSVDNETAVKNISKMAQEKGCTASVEKVSDAEWHVTVATSGAVAVADPEQDGTAKGLSVQCRKTGRAQIPCAVHARRSSKRPSRRCSCLHL